MKQDVCKFIDRHNLFNEGTMIIVAISGGPDSMALLDLLHSLRNHYKIGVAACHVNHQLRGIESEEDVTFVKDYCNLRGISLFIKEVDVRQYAKQRRLGTQVAARELRYHWFEQLLSEYPGASIATGHHGDDQVETMLMKMTRGSVPLYSYGIATRRKLGKGYLIRPLLGITKEQIEQYCIEASITPRRDASNESEHYTRNRFRKDILPVLKRENAHTHEHWQRQAEWSKDDHELLWSLAEEALNNIIVEKKEREITFSRMAFLDISISLQRRCIHLILNYLYEKNTSMITSIHIEQVLELFYKEKGSAKLNLAASLTVCREYDCCHFYFDAENEVEEGEQELSVPGMVQTSLWTIEADIVSTATSEAHHQVVLDLEKTAFPLIVRTREVGDRIACRGMDGTKKVSRLFIDNKVTKHERNHWPIIVDGNGDVLWVPLLHRSRVSNVGPNTKKRIVVSCYRNNES